MVPSVLRNKILQELYVCALKGKIKLLLRSRNDFIDLDYGMM